jgi:ribonuclease R
MTKKSKKSKQKTPSASSGKQNKLFQNLLKMVEQFIGGKSFSPLTETELMQRLSLPSQHQEIFHSVLQELVDANLIEIVQTRYSLKQTPSDIMSGILKMHLRGFGFVQPHQPDQYPQDIFIPKHLTKNAVDGDEVEVLINQESISDKGPEGKVIAILSRARSHMAGTILSIDRRGQFLAYVPLLSMQQEVIVEPSDEHPLRVGDRIIMEVIDWGTRETHTLCRFSHHLGHISDPSCDIYSAIEEFELRADFPNRVLQEAQKLGNRVRLKDLKNREDLRHLTTFTIDPDTAKDFDDALSLTRNEEGTYHLGVHIADVSSYVQPGTALDEEAALRCNSTYFPGYCLPMLPAVLSENLCSLKPHVNRLTVSVLMRFDSQGSLLDYQIKRSVIKSAKRFTYREVKKILDGKKKSRHVDTLNLMVELCRLLKHKRHERGSLEFALPELIVLVDDKGMPYQTSYITYDITHQMVEEFMLKANELVAWDLTLQGKNLTYRIHEEPAEENLRDFAFLAAAFGFRIPDRPTPQDFQKLFEQAANSPYVNYLASSYIRRMRLAAYSPENIGHYGLSLTHYCHFTSPIRRYIDLVIHRILLGESQDLSYLQQVASRCSEQERMSAKAENHVSTLKKLRLLHQMQLQEPYKRYDAIITRIKHFGIYFEILELLLEGFIHISEIEDDYLIFEEEAMRLRGRYRGNIYAPGARLTVILQEVDLIAQEAKWIIVGQQPFQRLKVAKKKKKKAPDQKPSEPAIKPLAPKRKKKKTRQKNKKIKKSHQDS